MTTTPPGLLPPLRQDLRLLPGPTASSGAPTWSIHDPARHRFVRVGWLEFEILSRWDLARPDLIAASISAETTIRATGQDVMDMLAFLLRTGLIVARGDKAMARLADEARSRRLSAAGWLLKNYLFLRVRLINPDPFLRAAQPYVAWMFTAWFAATLAGMALTGLLVIGRQWDRFSHGLVELFSPRGALLVAAALAFAKITHEFGHGLVARRFRCRVPAMGVALLVLWPVLWTDTTDAWRLTDRRKRLAVDAGGMAAELVLAVAASLLWAVLPDGPARSAAFLLCGSTWIVTLAVNLNPLMRFDGYFLLSDWLDLPNLQDRAFAFARWRLREFLFGLGVPAPEHFDRRRRVIILTYAFCTWIYRFGLFLGIAILVYHLAFKLLGLFLMAVEIWWFLARPILRELTVWWLAVTRRAPNRRTLITAAAALTLLALSLVPWRTRIEAPALLRAERQAEIYSAEPGDLLSATPDGTHVAAGAVLFQMESAPLRYREAAARATVAGLRADLTGQAFDKTRAEALEIGRKQWESALAELESVQAQKAGLTVTAPFAGMMTDVPPGLRPGVTLPRRESLGFLIDPHSMVIEAFVDEGDITRFGPGAAARFVPEGDGATIPLITRAVSPISVRVLDAAELASPNGGALAARQGPDRRMTPEHAVYRVLLTPEGAAPPVIRRQRGTVTIAAERRGILRDVYDRAAGVLIRESGL